MSATENPVFRIAILVMVFLFLGIFIIVVLVRYRSQQRKSLQDKKLMKAEFDQQLSLSKLEIQDETFNFISQEIHDNVGQILSLVKMQLNVMLEKNEFSAIEVELVRSNTGRAINELRTIAKSLNNEWLDTLDLSEAIRRELDYINRGARVSITLYQSGQPAQLSNKSKIIIFRIVQEVCQNIIKHAEAISAAITIQYLQRELSITITDDGKGFVFPLADDSGMGLKNIRKRIALLRGKIDVRSSPGNGTNFDFLIPYTI
jgi:two-component system NarL family sensor kinase